MIPLAGLDGFKDFCRFDCNSQRCDKADASKTIGALLGPATPSNCAVWTDCYSRIHFHESVLPTLIPSPPSDAVVK